MQHEELREIQRQNKITAQILENFLERRLFPNKRPTHKLPTLDEILPKTTTEPPVHQHRPTPQPLKKEQLVVVDGVDDNEKDDQDDQDFDPESLQSVESEHVDSYYDDYIGYKNGGRSLRVYFFFIWIWSIHIFR